jgi:hypothetical protein
MLLSALMFASLAANTIVLLALLLAALAVVAFQFRSSEAAMATRELEQKLQEKEWEAKLDDAIQPETEDENKA